MEMGKLAADYHSISYHYYLVLVIEYVEGTQTQHEYTLINEYVIIIIIINIFNVA